MSKIIVFSGHGRWDLGTDEFVQMPAKCSIKFYTMNAKLLSDSLGGDIDRGIIAGLQPDQEARPFKTVPDMRLFPPDGLSIQRPNPTSWHVVELPGLVPVDDKNLQVRIKPHYQGGASLSVMLRLLAPAIHQAESVMFLWAACREVKLRDVGGEALGVNVMQR